VARWGDTWTPREALAGHAISRLKVFGFKKSRCARTCAHTFSHYMSPAAFATHALLVSVPEGRKRDPSGFVQFSRCLRRPLAQYNAGALLASVKPGRRRCS